MKSVSLSIPASWKSTAIGIVGAVIGVIQVSKYEGNWQMAIHDPTIQLAIALAVLGAVSKDANVTGGTSAATPEAQARVENAPKA